MKHFLQYTLISLLAGLIFYGGAGVNWVTYCCDDCFKVGIQAAISETCCNTHTYGSKQEQTIPAMTMSESVVGGLHNCGIERVEFEWTSLENERSLIILPVITDALYNLSYTYLLTDSDLSANICFQEDDPPAVAHPREYLTLLTTLLI